MATKLGTAGLHLNRKSTEDNIVVAPFQTSDVKGLDELLMAQDDDESIGSDIGINLKNHRGVFDLCQKAGAIPKTVKFDDVKLQFNPFMGAIRVVTKDYCPMAAEAEAKSRIDELLAQMNATGDVVGAAV